MSAVLDRELFKNQDSTGTSRGTGITSGLVDDFKSNLETLRQLDLVPERKPFDAFDAYAPALMTFFGALGQPAQPGAPGPISAATQQIGQAAIASAPLFGQAAQAKAAFDASDPEAGLKEMALNMAIEESKNKTEPRKLKSYNEIFGDFTDAAGTISDADGIAMVYDNGDIEYIYNGQIYDTFKSKGEKPETVPEKFYAGKEVTLRNKTDGTTVSAILQTSDLGNHRLIGLGDDKKTFNFNDYEFDEESATQFKQNLKLKIDGQVVDAFQSYDKNLNEVVIKRLDNNEVLTPGTFTLVSDDEKNPEFFASTNYDVTINGETQRMAGIQVDDTIFVFNEAGNKVDVSTLPGFSGVIEAKVQPYESVDEANKKMMAEKNYEAQIEIAQDSFKKITSDGDAATSAIKNYNQALRFIENATTGSFAEQRAGVVRFLETFNVQELAPTAYNTIKAALAAGNTAPTELLNQAAKEAFLTSAQRYDDRLNNTEVRILQQANFNLALSPQGQKLMIELAKGSDQIKANGAAIVRALSAGTGGDMDYIISEFGDVLGEDLINEIRASDKDGDGKLDIIQSVDVANRYINKALIDYGNSDEVKALIAGATSIEYAKDQAFMNDQENVEFADGEVLIPGKAFQEGTLRFGGYAVDGEFSFGEGDNEFKESNIDNTKPVYVYEYKDGDKIIRQFVQF